MTTDESLAIIRRHLWVSGLVQGVWYRDTCEAEARARNLAGWCRNLDDFRVEIVVEGLPDHIESFIAWCSEGPPKADVSDVAVREEVPEFLDAFRVLW